MAGVQGAARDRIRDALPEIGTGKVQWRLLAGKRKQRKYQPETESWNPKHFPALAQASPTATHRPATSRISTWKFPASAIPTSPPARAGCVCELHRQVDLLAGFCRTLRVRKGGTA